MKRSTKVTVLQRIKEVTSMLIKGYSREDILQFASKKWKVSDRQIDDYISKAKTELTDSIKKDIKYDYSKAVRRYEELFMFCMKKKDYKTALSANKELATLQGLLKTQVEHSGNVQFISNIPD